MATPAVETMEAALVERAKQFAERFNKDFSRNPMGSGPYKFAGWKTGQEVVLERDPNYWGNGKAGIDQTHIDRQVRRVFNNMDAALVALKAGDLDTMSLQPIQHLRQTSGGALTSSSPNTSTSPRAIPGLAGTMRTPSLATSACARP